MALEQDSLAATDLATQVFLAVDIQIDVLVLDTQMDILVVDIQMDVLAVDIQMDILVVDILAECLTREDYYHGESDSVSELP